MIKAIIFDFDGVIADSIKIKTNAFAELYGLYGKAVVDKVIKHHQLNGGISRFEKFKYYHKEFLGVDLNEKDINELAEQFSELVIDKIVHAPYIPGAEEYIKKNYNKYLLFISSGTPKKELVEICKQRGIVPYFKKIYGSPEEKSYHIKEILISKEEPSEIIIENNNHEIKSDNADEFITHKKKNDVTKRILSNLFVIIITFVAIIIVADTFEQNLSSLIPGLLPLLDNLYETLYDLQLFIKDLLN